MALEKEGSKVYSSITDLPEISSINDGDKILLQTPTGTALLDFINFIITLDNCSFKTSFNDMNQSYQSNSDLINKIGSEEIIVDNLSANNTSLSAAVTQLNDNINALKDTVASYKSKINEIIDSINNIPGAQHINPLN